MGFGYNEFGVGFGLFGVMFTIAFVLIIGVFIVMIVRSIGTWNQNNHSPRLTVTAMVVSKRTDVSHHHSYGMAGNMTGVHGHTTTYYVTFQVESGDRMEFSVRGTQYGMLVEGDMGRLSFQGTRYLAFERS